MWPLRFWLNTDYYAVALSWEWDGNNPGGLLNFPSPGRLDHPVRSLFQGSPGLKTTRKTKPQVSLLRQV